MRPELALITDTHLEDGNEDLMVLIYDEVRELCQQRGLNRAYHGGDVFHNRKHQTQSTLLTLDLILERAKDKGFEWRKIPGNHDKANYQSVNSYLDVYRHHEALTLVTEWETFEEGPYTVHMIPFFDEKSTYSSVFQNVRFDKSNEDRHILITHIAVDGVRNNDGTQVEGALKDGLFGHYEKVFVGHYHDKQEIGKNILYVGASHQHNYGEDRFKGVTFLYADGSIEQVELKCVPKFNTVKIDLDNETDEDIDRMIADSTCGDENVRLKFIGSRDKLKLIDRKQLRKDGIDVKFEESEVDVDLSYVGKQNFKAFKAADIILNWDPFCKTKGVEEEVQKIGQNVLKTQLNG